MLKFIYVNMQFLSDSRTWSPILFSIYSNCIVRGEWQMKMSKGRKEDFIRFSLDFHIHSIRLQCSPQTHFKFILHSDATAVVNNLGRMKSTKKFISRWLHSNTRRCDVVVQWVYKYRNWHFKALPIPIQCDSLTIHLITSITSSSHKQQLLSRSHLLVHWVECVECCEWFLYIEKKLWKWRNYRQLINCHHHNRKIQNTNEKRDKKCLMIRFLQFFSPFVANFTSIFFILRQQMCSYWEYLWFILWGGKSTCCLMFVHCSRSTLEK